MKSMAVRDEPMRPEILASRNRRFNSQFVLSNSIFEFDKEYFEMEDNPVATEMLARSTSEYY